MTLSTVKIAVGGGSSLSASSVCSRAVAGRHQHPDIGRRGGTDPVRPFHVAGGAKLRDDRDPPMAQVEQVADRRPAGVHAVGQDGVRRQPRNVAVEQHHRRAVPCCVGQVAGLDRACRRHDDAIDLLLQQQADRFALQGHVLVAVGQDGTEAVAPRDVADSPHGAGEERVGDVGADDADRVGAAGDHAARQAVRPVAQLLGGLPDPLADFFPDVAIVAERASCRRG
jgi:hypothetical protein